MAKRNMKLVGTFQNDNLEGSQFSDKIWGDTKGDVEGMRSGDDIIDGKAGNDFLVGDAGDDIIDYGVGGNDVIDAGAGNDRLYGDAKDKISNDATGGDDIILAGSGNDKAYGDSGKDIRNNSLGGNDLILTGSGKDLAVGDAGHDIRDQSTGGNDTLIAANFDGSLPDLLLAVADTLAGSNALPLSNDGGHFIGDAGHDIQNESQGGDDFIFASNGRDWIYGDAKHRIIDHSHGGNDRLFGNAGNDQIFGDAGHDIRENSSGGDDEIDGGLGNDLLVGDAGGSIVDDSTGGNDILRAGNDTLVVVNNVHPHRWREHHCNNDKDKSDGNNSNSLYGDARQNISKSSTGGNDQLIGSDIRDYLFGDAGRDITWSSHGGNDTFWGGDGDDKISGDAGNSIYGNSSGGNDIIYGDGGNDRITGDAWDGISINSNAGDDEIHGGDGNDVIYGDSMGWITWNSQGGNDKLFGDDGDDIIFGDASWVSFSSDGGNDILQGGSGNDWLDGNKGNDIAIYDWDLNNSTMAYTDDYTGGEGFDCLVIRFSEDSNIAQIALAITDFNSFLTASPTETDPFDFNPYGFDLVVRGFEEIKTNALAQDDVYMLFEDTVFDAASQTLSVFDNDFNFDNDDLTIVAINGSAASVDTMITLASGAKLSVDSMSGRFIYDTAANGAFDYLAVGETATESFTYTVVDGLLDTMGDPITTQATVTMTIKGVNDGPNNLLITVTPTIDENGIVTLTGSFDDLDLTDSHSITIHWGDLLSPGNIQTITVAPTGTIGREFTVTHTYLDDNPTNTAVNSYNISVSVDDSIATTNASTATIVNNVAPTLTLDSVTSIDENGIATLTGMISDPGTLDTFTLEINWGDANSLNNTETYLFNASTTGTQSFAITHQYLDDNPTGTSQATYTISANLTDDDTGTDIAFETVVVENVAPVILLSPVASIDENGIATLTGSLVDPGTLDTFTVIVNWGDALSPNNTETFTFAASATGTQNFTLTHQYLDDNPTDTVNDTYTITATVTDDDTGSHMTTETVTVNNVAPTLNNLRYDYSFDGQIVVEAEDFDSRTTSAAGQDWRIIPTEDPGIVPLTNARNGEYLQALPDGVANNLTDDVFGPDEAVLSYNVTITEAGTYELITRVGRFDGGSDSIYVRIAELVDGPGGVHNDFYVMGGYLQNGSFVWRPIGGAESTGPGGNSPIVWDITTPGDYTVQYAFREDGTSFDAFVLQLANLDDIPQTNIGPLTDRYYSFEGETIGIRGQVMDVGTLDSFRILVDWQDGSTSDSADSGSGIVIAADGTFTASHIYNDNAESPDNTYVANVTVIDDDGGIVMDSINLVIQNLAPTITGIDNNNVNGELLISGETVTFGASFTDPAEGFDDNYSVDWVVEIDGATYLAPTAMTTTYADGVSDYSFNINPVDNGTVTVKVTITDKDGGSSTVTVAEFDSCSLVVTTTADDLAGGTLREAIDCANRHAGHDTITLNDGIYSITQFGSEENDNVSGDFDITDSLTIVGNGIDSTIIEVDAGIISKIFEVFSGVTLRLENLTLRDGTDGGLFADNANIELVNVHITDMSGNSAVAVNNASTITITDSLFDYNDSGTSINGGALSANESDVYIVGSTFDQNSGRGGGAILYGNFGSDETFLSIDNTDFTSNQADLFGGAIEIAGNTSKTINISNGSYFHDNGLSDNIGGAIIIFDSNSIMTVDNTIFDANTGSDGGAIAISGGSNKLVTLQNNTIISNNIATGDGLPGGGDGAGILITGNNSLYVDDSNISGNFTQTGWGGGVFINGQNARAVFNNVTLTGNDADAGGAVHVLNRGTAEFYNSEIVANNADQWGGGLRAHLSSKVVINNTQIIDNTASGNSGGINTDGGNTISIENNSLISGNTSSYAGAIGVYNDSDVTISDSIISGNTGTTSTGGILLGGNSTLTMTNSHLDGNTGSDYGGLIAYGSGNSVTIAGSTIHGNTSVTGTAGLAVFNSTDLNIDATTISNNTATSSSSSFGGVWFATDQNSHFSLTNSTVSNNQGLFAAGVRVEGTSDALISNTTFSGNSGTFANGGGQALHVLTSTVTLNNSTITQNTATFEAVVVQSGTLDLSSTVIAQNGANNDLAVFGGTVNSDGTNFIGNAGTSSPSWAAPGDQIGTTSSPLDAMLGPLADNGGPTQTHLPLPGSPLIDSGANTFGLDTDQRGFVRERPDGSPDIGAVERLDNLFSTDNDVVDFNGSLPAEYDVNNSYDALAGDDVVMLPTIVNLSAISFNPSQIFNGNTGNDMLYGADNNDHLMGGGDNDYLSGGEGIDTAYYTGDVDGFILKLISDTTIYAPSQDDLTFNFDASLDTNANASLESTNAARSDFKFNLVGTAAFTTATTNYTQLVNAIEFNGNVDSESGADFVTLADVNQSFQNLGGSPNATNSDASFELWFRPDNSSALTRGQILFETGGSGTGMAISLDKMDVVATIQAGEASEQVLRAVGAVDTTEYMQVVLTYARDVNATTNDIMSLYINGSLVKTVTVSNINDWAGTDSTGLGKLSFTTAADTFQGSGTSDNFDGQISIFRFYEQTLDADAVLNNYNAIVNPEITSYAVTVDDRVITDGDDGFDTIAGVEIVNFNGQDYPLMIGSDISETLNGDSLNNYILGQAGQDILFGLGGQDVLHGGEGDDILSGGNDADVFVALSDVNDGHDTIVDFMLMDKILFDATGTTVTDFADLTANHMSGNSGSTVPHDVEINYGASSLTLEDVTFLLDASHFEFI